MNKVARFEKVTFEQFKIDFMDKFGEHYSNDDILQIYQNIKIPKRATKGSAGHDISIPFSISVAATDTLVIPTGIRCEMEEDYVMYVHPRSSLCIKMGIQLVNQTGVIDSDYAHADNEGHIFVYLKNTSSEVVHFEKGENVVQAVFIPFGVADEEEVTEERTGGIGSTTHKESEITKNPEYIKTKVSDELSTEIIQDKDSTSFLIN